MTSAHFVPVHAMATNSASTEAPLEHYNRKRDFKITSEPSGVAATKAATPRRKKAAAVDQPHALVLQKHWASRLHYDFRLEWGGVLLSWACPKGLSFDPADKRMAVHVEDHPVDYRHFEGTIPAKQYGAGTVIVWDHGSWEPVGDADAGMAAGKLLFKLHGEKLAGLWELVRISKPGEKNDQWMIFKKRDEWARPLADYDVIQALPDSVVTKPLGLLEARESKAVAAESPTKGEADLGNAVKAALPATLEPQLATLATEAPAGGDWLPESKFDGYRFLIRIDKGRARFITRGGHDWTDKMPTLAAEVEKLGVKTAWLDGEVVVLNAHGVPDFGLLQNAIGKKGGSNDELALFLFDAPFFEGFDLRRVPLWSRRAVLRKLLDGASGERVRFSEDFPGAPHEVLDAACALNLEGVILKRSDAPYESGRTETWLKLKCSLRQEFVVVGFTDRSNARGEVGGLLLAYHEDGALRYAGNVGTGWNTKTGRELHALFSAIQTDVPAFDAKTVKPGRWSKRTAGSEHWVRPERVVEVSFGEWTADGHVRHGVFKGLREDKPAGVITRETAKSPPTGSGGSAATAPRKTTPLKVSNPQRVIDASTGLTKLDLVRYYESVADRILPHLKDRPVSLVRAPEGIAGELFFQKHLETKMPGMTVLDADLWPGHGALLAVNNLEALLSAAQMNTVEFHTWNSVVQRVNEPDRVIFDLDPGDGVTWAHLQEAALLTRAMLGELDLQSWIKTSGGKGLHVVVPLAPKLNYETVKAFSQAVVQHMARTIPDRFVAKMGGTNRVGKIFIDYLRNGHAQTTACAFSARSRPGLGVSMPISWEQLATVKGGAQWTIATAREYLSFEKVDPWADYWKASQSLASGMKTLGVKAVAARRR
ncbi:MAG: ATP-dependent ligase LigD phosphoesterase module / ATP-dependent ligase LigD polymerase [Rhizobacter sp.]|nr:ATP-dependent ligase LigD phosphoesterase module / ATP-dependent ligase LigD polymerase [Rhizobacter sp.]